MCFVGHVLRVSEQHLAKTIIIGYHQRFREKEEGQKKPGAKHYRKT